MTYHKSASEFDQISHFFQYAFMALFLCDVTAMTCREPDNVPLEIASSLYDMYTADVRSDFSQFKIPCSDPCSEGMGKLCRNVTTSIEINNRHGLNVNDGQTSTEGGRCGIPLTDGRVVVDMGLYKRTKCPWTYEVDVDNNRLPKRITRAVCACRHCHRGRCVPVMTYEPVVRRECDNVTGVFRYRKYLEQVPAACVCVASERAEHLSHARMNSRWKLKVLLWFFGYILFFY